MKACVVAIAIALALAACGYDASFRDCTIGCSSATGCPNGFTCSVSEALCRTGETSASCAAVLDGGVGDGGTIDGPRPVDASCPGDLDCDGIADSIDNCPTISNADQANEDGDKFGDACDPCPTVADDNPPDSDGDGVADACDPRPSTPGDKITLFEGFHHGVPAGWIVNGPWADGGSDDVLISGAAAASSLTISGIATEHETVSASVTVVANGSATTDIGIVDDYAHAGDSGIACGLYDALNTVTGGRAQYLWLRMVHTGTATSIAMPSYEVLAGKTYQLTETRGQSSFDCSGNDGTVAMDASGSSALDNAPPEVGLRIEFAGTTARFQWVMVVSSPP